MRSAVQAAFYGFNKPFEAEVPWMYLDVKGLVTVGVGNMLPTADAAAALPFVHGDDTSNTASDDEKRQGWQTIKARTDLTQSIYTVFKDLCDLRLTSDGMSDLVASKLASNEGVLRATFSNFDDWPADAQLGVLSMAWAMGPGFPASWPSFTAACKQLDFTTASAQCRMSETGNPGVKPRNDADQTLFNNAAQVLKLGTGAGYSPDTLYYPTIIMEEIVITAGAPDDSSSGD